MVDWELVKKLIKTVKEEGISGLAIEEDGVKYEVQSSGGQIVAHPPVPVAAQPKAEPQGKEDDSLTAIVSPMVGTFYRSASPEKPPYAEVSQKVKAGDVVCIIEAMKLFNEIESEVSGTIVKVMVDNEQPVEYDQVLFLVKPD